MKHRFFHIPMYSMVVILIILVGCSGDKGMEAPPENSAIPSSSHQETDEAPSDAPGSQEAETGSMEYSVDPRIPKMVRELILENRKYIFQTFNPGDEDRFYTEYMYTERNDDEDQRIADVLSGCLQQGAMPDTIALQQAEEDVRFLFDYLKYYYAGYDYFGADAVFHPIRDETLTALSQMGDPVPVQALGGIVSERLLPVVKDGHFGVGSISFGYYNSNNYFCVYDGLEFAEEDGAYVTQVDGVPYRLASVDGLPPDDLFAYLNAAGEPCWVVGWCGNTPEKVTKVLQLDHFGTGERIEQEITLTPADADYGDGFEGIYQLDDGGEVPVVVNRRLWGEGEEAALLEAMVEEAPSLRGSPVVIVDLRGNGGGNSEYASRWVQGFVDTEEWPFPNNIRATRYSRTVLTVMQQMMGMTIEEMEEMGEQQLGRAIQVGDADVQFPTLPQEPYPNDSLVVVLADQSTGSAGEDFVESLCQMENTLLIGTNTGGCLSYVPAATIYLPGSRLPIQCGYTLNIRADLSEFEGIGLQPDLWAPPGQSLERTLLFLANYDLIP